MKLVILLKGRKLPEGAIRTWKDGIKRKKVNGKWIPVKKGKHKAASKPETVKEKPKPSKPIDKFDSLAKAIGASRYEIQGFITVYNVDIPEDFKTSLLRESRQVEEKGLSFPDMGYKWLNVFKEAFKKRIGMEDGLISLLRKDYGFELRKTYRFEGSRFRYQDWTEEKQLDMLNNGKIVAMYKNGSSGVNGSFVVSLENKNGERMDAIFKPQACERKDLRSVIPNGTQYIREVAAYEVNKAFDMGLVPPTVERYNGSLQMIVGGAKELLRTDESELEEEGDIEQLEKASLFDYLTYNTDRHLGNILFIEPSKEVSAGYKDFALIDHGLSFPRDELGFKGESYRLLNELQGASSNNKYEISMDLVHKLDLSDNKRNELKHKLQKIGLDQESIDQFLVRIKSVKNIKAIPPMEMLY